MKNAIGTTILVLILAGVVFSVAYTVWQFRPWSFAVAALSVAGFAFAAWDRSQPKEHWSHRYREQYGVHLRDKEVEK